MGSGPLLLPSPPLCVLPPTHFSLVALARAAGRVGLRLCLPMANHLSICAPRVYHHHYFTSISTERIAGSTNHNNPDAGGMLGTTVQVILPLPFYVLIISLVFPFPLSFRVYPLSCRYSTIFLLLFGIISTDSRCGSMRMRMCNMSAWIESD